MGLIHTYITEKSNSVKGNMKTRSVLAKNKQQENQDALFDMRVDTITEQCQEICLPDRRRF